MQIEIATEFDLVELTEVEIESKIHSISELLSSVDIEYETRLHRWQTYFNMQSPQSSKPERLILKAINDKKIVGYIAGHLSNRFNIDSEIQSFYVLKENQNSGIGFILFKSLIDWFSSHEVKSLCVGIVPLNKYKRFYYKYGGQDLNEHWIHWTDIRTIR